MRMVVDVQYQGDFDALNRDEYHDLLDRIAEVLIDVEGNGWHVVKVGHQPVKILSSRRF
jgi:hypothetical protein